DIDNELQRHIQQLSPEDTASGYVVYEAACNRKIRNIFHLHKTNSYFAALAKSPQFIELGQAIFEDDPVLVSVELFAKPARVGSEVPYHQDNAYFNLTPADAFTCWIALADAT